MKQSSLTALLGTQMTACFSSWTLGGSAVTSVLSQGVLSEQEREWHPETAGSLARKLGSIPPEELNYVEEDSSKEFCGCCGWSSTGGSWGGKSFCRRPSSWAVEISALVTVSGTWKRKAVIKIEAWWGPKCQLSGCCLPPSQQESYHWPLHWHHWCYNCRQGKISSNNHQIQGLTSCHSDFHQCKPINGQWEETSLGFPKKAEGHMPPRSMKMRSTQWYLHLFFIPASVFIPGKSHDWCMT